MTSLPFKKALTATSYIASDGTPAPGLTRATDGEAVRLRSVLQNQRVGLNADAVFSVQGTPTAIFKDAGAKPPTNKDIQHWHEAAWNLGVAPLLWIVTPTEVRLYNCYESPPRGDESKLSTPLDTFALDASDRLRALDAMCGRLATETGAFWSSEIGSKIDRRHRVDRELLSEIKALEEQLTGLPPAQPSGLKGKSEVKASRDFAQRLIGRCIFTWYLLDRQIAQPFLPELLKGGLSTIFGMPKRAFALFSWLRTTFNGDLFPMDDPGAERQRLSPKHLALIRDFVEGRSLVPGAHGQGRMFRFRFDAIPVDLISAIYQQFARSSAEEDAHLQGLHYTPIEVVHLTLDPVFEGLANSARIVDPACGSGAFLVEAFRRLIWKNSVIKQVTRAQLREILYNKLFGVDINRSALGIAAFSLYLAALEFDEEPVTSKTDLKFDRLIGETLFEADTINDELPKKLTEQPFDAVVGNPPWTFDSRNRAQPRREGDDDTARPRRSPDQAFLGVAARLAGEGGRIGMIMKATPFFSKDKHAVAARNVLLRKLKPAAIVNMSALRKEELFPDATGPALLFFARCKLMPGADQLLTGSVPWTADFRRNGMFHIGPGELRSISLARVLRTPAFLKAATFGTVRDGWLIEKLERELPTLDAILTKVGLEPLTSRGQGFQVEGDLNKPPKHYYDLDVIVPGKYNPFRLDPNKLERFEHKTLHRSREPAIFNGPLVLCPKASFKAAAQLGRYSAAVSTADLLYTESFYGISFANQDPKLAFALSAVLNSSMASFQFAFSGGAWGLERATVEPKDLLSLRIPDLVAEGADLTALVRAEAAAAANPNDEAKLEDLDNAVFELYGLDPDEAVLVSESVDRARMLIFEGRAQRKRFIIPPAPEALGAYAGAVVRVVDGYLRAKGQRHLEATVYWRALVHANWTEGSPGLTMVRFSMASGSPINGPVVRQREDRELDGLSELIRSKLQSNIAPYLNERRLLRVYLDEDLFVLKPSEARYWTQTSGLNDADVILADHWLGDRHAVHA